MGGRLKFERATLDEMFSQLNLDNEELAKKTGEKNRAIKNWRSGACTMPTTFFAKLCDLEPRTSRFLEKGRKLEQSWGRVLGGKRTAGQMSKSEIGARMKKVRSQLSKNFPKIDEISISNPEALEFYGIMMGDGCVSRYPIKGGKEKTSVVISGNSEKDRAYFEGFLVPLMGKVFGVRINSRKRRSSGTIDAVTCASHVSKWLVKHGFPVGMKGRELKMPPELMSLPPESVNNVIRGLFDTDGCVTARKDEGYKYPYIFIWSISSRLREQVKSVLNKQGIPAYIHGQTVVVRGCNNFKIWFKKIGSSNPRNICKYDEWISTGTIKPTGL
ncbi:hypothetical protein JW721_04070 [Candidatus Micrarchaeota archaeon]|nr:hypothetical protein [Candidatus Micrarchaeota archaeon]